MTADPGVTNSILAQSHIFMEIDREINSTSDKGVEIVKFSTCSYLVQGQVNGYNVLVHWKFYLSKRANEHIPLSVLKQFTLSKTVWKIFQLVLNEMGPGRTSPAWYFHSPDFKEQKLAFSLYLILIYFLLFPIVTSQQKNSCNNEVSHLHYNISANISNTALQTNETLINLIALDKEHFYPIFFHYFYLFLFKHFIFTRWFQGVPIAMHWSGEGAALWHTEIG